MLRKDIACLLLQDTKWNGKEEQTIRTKRRLGPFKRKKQENSSIGRNILFSNKPPSAQHPMVEPSAKCDDHILKRNPVFSRLRGKEMSITATVI